MARSRRKAKVGFIYGGESDRWHKQKANRKLRRLSAQFLNQVDTDEEVVLPELREVSNNYNFRLDGRFYAGIEADPKQLRK